MTQRSAHAAAENVARVLYVMYPGPLTALTSPVKTLVNLFRLVIVAEAAALVEVLVEVVEVEVNVDNAIAFVFEQVVATALAGPHWMGLHPGS